MMLGQRLVLVTLYRGLQLVLSKTTRIGDIKYHIQCTNCEIPCNEWAQTMCTISLCHLRWSKLNITQGGVGEEDVLQVAGGM